jgi:hypothetical protein
MGGGGYKVEKEEGDHQILEIYLNKLPNMP